MTLLLSLCVDARDYRKTGNTIAFDNLAIEILSPSMFSVRPVTDGRPVEVKTDLGVVSIPDFKADCRITKENKV